VSLTAFASVFLTAAFLYEHGGAERLRNRALPPGFRYYAFGLLAYIYALVYLGAYVRHSNASMACVDWPLCNGQVFPGFGGSVGIAFAHRLAALAGMLLIAGLFAWSVRLRASRPDLYRASALALVLVLLQAFSGAIVVWTRLDIFSTLSHAGIVTLLFGALSYICYHALPLPKPRTAEQARSAPAGAVSLGSPAER
jgi:cytochrome c oxidase assembly protein subunit 15